MLPRGGTCPSCHEAMEWGEVIRSCYGRKAGLELERLETGKGDRKARRKAERQAAKGTAQISATEEDSGHESAVSMTDGDAEADVVDQSRTSSRKSGPSGVSPLTKKINSLILVSPPKRRRSTGGSKAYIYARGKEESEGESPSKKAASRRGACRHGESTSTDLEGRKQASSSRRILPPHGARPGRKKRSTARRQGAREDRPSQGQSGSESEMEWQRLDREMMAYS